MLAGREGSVHHVSEVSRTLDTWFANARLGAIGSHALVHHEQEGGGKGSANPKTQRGRMGPTAATMARIEKPGPQGPKPTNGTWRKALCGSLIVLMFASTCAEVVEDIMKRFDLDERDVGCPLRSNRCASLLQDRPKYKEYVCTTMKSACVEVANSTDVLYSPFNCDDVCSCCLF